MRLRPARSRRVTCEAQPPGPWTHMQSACPAGPKRAARACCPSLTPPLRAPAPPTHLDGRLERLRRRLQAARAPVSRQEGGVAAAVRGVPEGRRRAHVAYRGGQRQGGVAGVACSGAGGVGLGETTAAAGRAGHSLPRQPPMLISWWVTEDGARFHRACSLVVMLAPLRRAMPRGYGARGPCPHPHPHPLACCMAKMGM